MSTDRSSIRSGERNGSGGEFRQFADRIGPVRLRGDHRDVPPGNHAGKTQAGLEGLDTVGLKSTVAGSVRRDPHRHEVPPLAQADGHQDPAATNSEPR